MINLIGHQLLQSINPETHPVTALSIIATSSCFSWTCLTHTPWNTSCTERHSEYCRSQSNNERSLGWWCTIQISQSSWSPDISTWQKSKTPAWQCYQFTQSRKGIVGSAPPFLPVVLLFPTCNPTLYILYLIWCMHSISYVYLQWYWAFRHVLVAYLSLQRVVDFGRHAGPATEFAIKFQISDQNCGRTDS
jgi:hypothetical protein